MVYQIIRVIQVVCAGLEYIALDLFIHQESGILSSNNEGTHSIGDDHVEEDRRRVYAVLHDPRDGGSHCR